MTTFFLDLWQDLRAKRLWPIALGLLVATVAVPVLLSKPASTPPPAGATQAAGGAKLPVVALDASSVDGSHLNIFKEKNPFKGLADKTTAAGTGTSAPVGSSVASAATSASTGSGSTPSGAPGSGSAPTGPNGKPISPGVHYFTYTADVVFGPRSSLKTYKSVNELDVLPDGKSPIVSFMGVKGGNTAVFFIADPSFQAQGEGSCQPSPANCTFLYMKKDVAHDEETLSAQGGQVEYTLKLTGLHIKMLSASEAVGSTTPDKSPAASKTKNGNGLTRKTLLTMPTVGVTSR